MLHRLLNSRGTKKTNSVINTRQNKDKNKNKEQEYLPLDDMVNQKYRLEV